MPQSDGGAQFGRDAIERGWMSREQASICFREAQARGEDFSLIAQQRGFLTAGQVALLRGLHAPNGPNYQAFANRLPARSPEPDEADDAQTIRITAPAEDVDPNAQTFVGAIRNEDLPDFLKPGARGPSGYDPNAQTFVGSPPAFPRGAAKPVTSSFDPAAQSQRGARAGAPVGTSRKTSPRIPASFDPAAQTIIGELSPMGPNDDGDEAEANRDPDFDPNAKTFVGAIADDDRPDFMKAPPKPPSFDPSAQTLVGDFKSQRGPAAVQEFDPSAPTIFGLKAPSAEPDGFDPSAQTLMGEVPVSPEDLDPLGQTRQIPGHQRFTSGIQRSPEKGLKRGSAQVPIPSVDPRAVTRSASPPFSIQNPQISSTTPGELGAAKPGSALLGSEVSGWRLERELGRGATGVVYLATRAHEKSALKLLGELDEAGKKRFQRELMAALAVSDQANVVKVLETGFHGGRPFIVMQLIEGHSLAAELAQHGRFEAPKALELMIQVTQAVAALHRRSLIHRDIKPENILLRKSDGQALVTDFGLARALNADTLTRSGDWVGTPQYMSPEQINGLRDQVDERSDIWALGATFYETLLARPAFEGEDLPSLVNAIVDEDPPALSSLRPELPKAWDLLIARALCKSREGRYASAAQMLEALQKLQKVALIEARPPGPLKRLWLSLVRRLGRGVASLLVLVAVLAPLALLASYQLQQARLRRERLTARARKLISPLGQEALSPAELSATVCSQLLRQCKDLEPLRLGAKLDLHSESPALKAISTANEAIAEALRGPDGPELRPLIAAEQAAVRCQILALAALAAIPAGGPLDHEKLSEDLDKDWVQLIVELASLVSGPSPESKSLSRLESLNSSAQSPDLRALAMLGLAIHKLRSQSLPGLSELLLELPSDPKLGGDARAQLEPYFIGLTFTQLAEHPLSEPLDGSVAELIEALYKIIGAKSPRAGLIAEGYARLLRKFEGPRAYEVFRFLHRRTRLKTWDLPALTASELFSLAESASKHELGLGDAVELYAQARSRGCERPVPEQYRSSFFLGYFNDVFSLQQDKVLAKRVFDAMLALTRAGEPIYVSARVIALFDDSGFFQTAQNPKGEKDPALCLWRGCYDLGKLAERYESSGRKNQDLEKTIRSRLRGNLEDLELASESNLAPPLRARAYLERFATTRFAGPWIEGLDSSRDKLQGWVEKAINLGLAKPDEAWKALWSLLPRAEVDQRSQYTARYKEAVLARFKQGNASATAPNPSEASLLVPIDEGERDRMLNSWRAMRADDELALGQPSAALPLAREAWDRDPMDENLALLYAEALISDQATGELKIFLEKTEAMPYAKSPRFQRAIAEASK